MTKIKKLVWDDWNIQHISKHDVIKEEVEDICHADPVVQNGKKGRLLVFGFTKESRMVTVVLDPEEEKYTYYPVTARSTSKKERRIYENEKQEVKK